MKDPDRDYWNSRQKTLRKLFSNKADSKKAITLFLEQHAMLHSAGLSQTGLISFEDEVLQDISESLFRRIPKNGEHSIAWVIFHTARIEDVTMNRLVADSAQVFEEENWQERLKSTIRHTANAMDENQIRQLSDSLDLDNLMLYRRAVGRRTREIVQQLLPTELNQKVDPARISKLLETGAVIEEARGIAEYWGRRTTAGLLLMPPTRHNFLHLNEVLRLKNTRK